MTGSEELVVGVLSDTHGHLYPPVLSLLQGVAHIIHAGDIGSPQVLSGLKAIAPVTAVRGNCDHGAWAAVLPVETQVQLGGVRIVVGHVAGHLRATVASEQGRDAFHEAGGLIFAPPRVVISGHTHRFDSQVRGDVLFLNPGSAGPERFGSVRTLARLYITPAQAGPPALAVPAAPDILPSRVRVEAVLVPES